MENDTKKRERSYIAQTVLNNPEKRAEGMAQMMIADMYDHASSCDQYNVTMRFLRAVIGKEASVEFERARENDLREIHVNATSEHSADCLIRENR